MNTNLLPITHARHPDKGWFATSLPPPPRMASEGWYACGGPLPEPPRTESFREILESCPLLHTSTCNHAERAWIERARAALAQPAASKTPARRYFDWMSTSVAQLHAEAKNQWAGAILRDYLGDDAPADDILLAKVAMERGLEISTIHLPGDLDGPSGAILTERGQKVRDVPLPPKIRWTE